jgi:membrane protease YdiL (CAAX protease family)
VFSYLAVVVFLSALLASCIPRFGSRGTVLVDVMMFIPALISVVYRVYYREGFQSVGWTPLPSRFWLLALLFPSLLLVASVPVTVWLGYASINKAALSVRLFWRVPLFSLLSVPFALGEELGWRGYAQDKLIDEFGVVKGLLILGFVWGFWHSPAFYFLRSFPDHPILGPLVMTPIDSLLVVAPFGWLYIRSRNIWVPTIAHALGDVLWGYSDMIVSKHSVVGCWAILQAAQLVVTIACLVDLMRVRFGVTPNLPLQPQSLRSSNSRRG